MELILFDSFTGSKKPFNPRNPNNTTVYICGPTVYDDAHLGHARTYVTFDLIRRMFEILGHNTTVVMNITDVDDKIINRAREQNMSPLELACKYEERFMEDMKSLEVQPPDVLTRVTEHIDEIIAFITDLIDKGYAYVKDKDVRFHLCKYLESYQYPGFHLHDIEDSGEEADFTLWKGRPDKNELNWDSPWGPGRPGWHIECSAMSTTVFGSHLDIHVGGIDLAFPHHANEIAQSNARYGDKWVNIFLHTGHLSIEGQKMSKSLKNFITIRKALEEYSSHILRMYFALHKYNGSMSFSTEELDRAKKTWETFQSFWRKVTGLPAEEKWSERSQVIHDALIKTRKDNIAALNDDFNLPQVLLNLLDLLSITNAQTVYSSMKNKRSCAGDNYPIAAMMVVKYTQDLLHRLGFPVYNTNSSDDITNLIQTLVDFRSNIRSVAGDKKSIYALTDSIRTDILPKLGIKLEDQGKKSYWSKI
ncbi:Cysteinyl-tRNA synthetase [uncultured virus]|nr:Cysteinyl-tRNA synthetase [uncultured virus]